MLLLGANTPGFTSLLAHVALKPADRSGRASAVGAGYLSSSEGNGSFL